MLPRRNSRLSGQIKQADLKLPIDNAMEFLHPGNVAGHVHYFDITDNVVFKLHAANSAVAVGRKRQ